MSESFDMSRRQCVCAYVGCLVFMLTMSYAFDGRSLVLLVSSLLCSLIAASPILYEFFLMYHSGILSRPKAVCVFLLFGLVLPAIGLLVGVVITVFINGEALFTGWHW